MEAGSSSTEEPPKIGNIHACKVSPKRSGSSGRSRTKPTCWSESPGFPTQHEPNQREFATILTNWAMSETFRQIR